MTDVRNAVHAVLDALDWAALGEVYFHADGEAELRQRRPAVLACGRALADLLLPRLSRSGASLWVGAGLAELPVLLAEAQRGRTVIAANLRAAECAILNRALEIAAPTQSLRFLPIDAQQAPADVPIDHLGCISLFTDPETWPVLSDVAYGRIAPVQLDVEQFVREREAARSLAAKLFARLQRPGWITTTAEEVAWFLDAADNSGVHLEPEDEMVESAIVGDPIGVLAVR